MTAGFSFTPVKFFTAGLLSQTRFEGKQVHEALTLSGNINLGNAFSTTLAWTVANRRYDNLGFGLAFRGGFFQFLPLLTTSRCSTPGLQAAQRVTGCPRTGILFMQGWV